MKVLNFLSDIGNQCRLLECYCSAGNGKWNVISELKYIEVGKRLLIKEVVTVLRKRKSFHINEDYHLYKSNLILYLCKKFLK